MRGRAAFALSLLAALWGALLVAGALTLPVYSGAGSSMSCTSAGVCSTTSASNESATLVGENGTTALAVVAAPLAAALLCALLLHRRCARGSRAALVAAWALVGALGAFALVALLTVGLLVVPVVALLAGSAALTPAPRGSD
jgi:hypothetical protein